MNGRLAGHPERRLTAVRGLGRLTAVLRLGRLPGFPGGSILCRLRAGTEPLMVGLSPWRGAAWSLRMPGVDLWGLRTLELRLRSLIRRG